MTNFVAKFTAKEDEDSRPATWMIWTDGSSNQRVGGAGVLLQLPEGYTVECVVRLQFPMTNNEAEYEAILLSLDLAKAAEASLVVLHYDS